MTGNPSDNRSDSSKLESFFSGALESRNILTVVLTVLGVWAISFIGRTIVWIDGDPYFSLFDDAMISMRYALNFVNGYGLVWNEGEAVEGYSNPLWTLWMAAAIAVLGKANAPLAIQVTGLSLLLLTVAISSRAAYEYWGKSGLHNSRPRTAAFLTTLMLVATLYPLHYWSLMGMEVSLLATMAAASVLVLVRVSTSRLQAVRGLLAIVTAAAISYFTRPDGFLVLLPLIVICLFYSLKQSPRQTIIALTWFSIFLAVLVAAHLLWRYQFYGSLVPNTYFLKVEGYDIGLRVSNGVGFMMEGFIQSYGIAFLLTVVLVVTYLRDNLLVAGLVFSFIISVSYQIYVGGDPWTYWRQLVPGLVLLFVGLGIAAGTCLRNVGQNRKGILFSALLSGVFLLCGFMNAMNARFVKEIVGLKQPYTIDSNEENLSAALALRQVLEPKATVLAFWAGTIPYYWGGKAIDPLGKSDGYIARLAVDQSVAWNGMKGVPGHAKYDFRHSVVEAKPDYVQFPSYGGQKIISEDYVSVSYKGLTLCLRKKSSLVRWSMVNVGGECE